MTEPETPPRELITSRDVFRWAVAGSLGVLAVAAVVYVVFSVANLLVQIAIAAFIAVSLDPAVRWLIARGVRRSLAVTIILSIFAGLLALVLWLAMPRLVSEAAKLTTDFPGYLENLRARSPSLRDLENRLHAKASVDAFAATFLDRVQHDAFAFSRRFLGALVQALLVIVLTIYFMLDLPRLRRAVVSLAPVRHRPRVSHSVNIVVDKVGAYMIGNLIISLIAGVSSFLAMLALGVPFALPLAVFVAVTDLIPLIGATLGAVVCTIVAIATTDLWPNAIVLALFFVAYQQAENYLIVPWVFRSSVDMPSVAVLLAALVGASVLGLVGALMAIPIAAAFKVILSPMMRARDAAEVSKLSAEPPPAEG